MQKSKSSKGQAEKLKELELSGLVDFDKSHARYFTFVPVRDDANMFVLKLGAAEHEDLPKTGGVLNAHWHQVFSSVCNLGVGFWAGEWEQGLGAFA